MYEKKSNFKLPIIYCQHKAETRNGNFCIKIHNKKIMKFCNFISAFEVYMQIIELFKLGYPEELKEFYSFICSFILNFKVSTNEHEKKLFKELSNVEG